MSMPEGFHNFWREISAFLSLLNANKLIWQHIFMSAYCCENYNQVFRCGALLLSLVTVFKIVHLEFTVPIACQLKDTQNENSTLFLSQPSDNVHGIKVWPNLKHAFSESQIYISMVVIYWYTDIMTNRLSISGTDIHLQVRTYATFNHVLYFPSQFPVFALVLLTVVEWLDLCWKSGLNRCHRGGSSIKREPFLVQSELH